MLYGEVEKCPKCAAFKLVGRDCLVCRVLDEYLRRG